MKKGQGYDVAIVGATGAVGNCFLRVLADRKFPIRSIKLLASERSAGKKLIFNGKPHPVEPLTECSFVGIQIALFSAGADRSKVFVPAAVAAGAVCVDNTSFFRMKPDVPLVVPEVNRASIRQHKGIIANPNCSTIQMVVALKPLHDAARIKRVVVSTYQSVSGAGQQAVNELADQARAWAVEKPLSIKKFTRQIAFNLIPHIDAFTEHAYTREEMKMADETRKILGDPTIRISATCVRVPVFYAHSESVWVETERKITADQARKLLAAAPGVRLLDDPAKGVYPTPLDAAGQDLIYVGRVREDMSSDNGLVLWVVADNLRKGAATNAVQIAECLIEDGLI